MKTNYEALVIGCGPSGITAAIELKNAGVDVALIEKDAPGGKINIAPRVDNYPGYEKISGPDLAMVFVQRLFDANVEFIGDEVLSLTKEGDIFTLVCKRNTYTSKTVLLATGTVEKKIGLPNEDKLFGHGLSYCALCDGHFFKGEDVAVIGGGDAALKEALYLTTLVNKLYVIHRRNEFRGEEYILNELKSHANVEFLTPYDTLEILEENNKVSGLKIQNKETKEIKILSIQGLFPLVGQNPNSKFIKIDNVVDEKGTVPFNEDMSTNVKGLYVAGDLTPRDIRQIYIAEPDGKNAAISMIKYLGK